MGRALTTRGAVMVALAAATVLLSGCAPAAPPAAESPPPSSQPIFASDAEALAAAEAAYAEYLAVGDSVLSGGGVDTESLLAVATGAALAGELETAESYASNGYRSIGTSKFDTLSIQNVEDVNQGALVTVYLCADVSDVDVVSADGNSVVNADRRDRIPLEVGLLSSEEDASKLLVSRSKVWSGADFC